MLELDNGEQFDLQDFQVELVEDVFAGFRETWFIVPEGNGKTTFMAALGLYHGDYKGSAMVPIGASSREQAEILYRQAEGFVLRTKGLRERFKCQEGYRRIKCLRTGGRIQVFAADDRTGDGIIPTLALVDELHRHRDLRLYRTWKGKLKKRAGQIVTISTAGEPGSEFEETRAQIHQAATEVATSHRGCHVRAAGEDVVIHDWRVPKRAQAKNVEIVALANPRAEITADVLRKERGSPTMTDQHWLRFVCNIATRTETSPITPEDIDPLALKDGEEVDGEAPVFGWLDLGWKIDTTAMGVIVWEGDERRVVTAVNVLEPPVDETDVVNGLLDLAEQFPQMRGVVYDPNAGGQQMAQLLERGDHPAQVARGAGPIDFFEHSQDNAPMADAAAKLDEAIRNGWLRHDGDPVLRRHMLNAARRDLGGEKWKYDRPPDAKGAKRAKYPIDALTGLLMGHRVALAENASSVYEDRGLLIA